MRFVLHAQGQWRDVDVHVDRADATVDDLARALAGMVPAGPPAPGPVPVLIDGRPVPGHVAVRQIDLYDGAVVSLGGPPPAGLDGDGDRLDADPRSDRLSSPVATDPRSDRLSSPVATDPRSDRLSSPVADSHASTAGVVEVCVLSGPEAGRAVPVGPGLRRLGRSADADVVLDAPTVSRAHAVLLVEPDGSARVANLSASSPTLVDGRPVPDAPRSSAAGADGFTPPAFGVPLAPGAVLTLGTVHLAVRPPHPSDALTLTVESGEAPAGTRHLNRPPRVIDQTSPAMVEPPAAPTTAHKAPFSVSAIAAPAVMGGFMAVVMQSPQYGLFALMSPVMVIGNWYESKHRSTKALRRETREYHAALETFEAAVTAAQHDEVARRRAALPDLAETSRRAVHGSIRLWERRRHHDDFLRLLLGWGDEDRPPPLPTRSAQQAPAPEVVEIVERHRPLAGVPVAADLGGAVAPPGGPAPGGAPAGAPGVVGIAGDRSRALALARSLVCQAAVHHGPADLRVVVLSARPAGSDTEGASDWDWAKWLPHTRADRPGGSERRLLAAGAEQADDLVTELAREHEAGAGPHTIRRGGDGAVTLLVVDGDELVSGSSALRRALTGVAGPAAGIVIAPTAARLPASCTAIVDLQELGEATVVVPRSGPGARRFDTAELSRARARRIARSLARWNDPERSSAGAGMDELVHLLPLLGLVPAPGGDKPAVTEEAIGRAWDSGARRHDLRAPIGTTEDGPFVIDFDRHGPHGLIGGTTGSGKSELLKTLVASLAARYPPTELTFGLFDFKGGATFTDFADLPHTVGMADDLDVHLAQRALRCLRAELLHREHVFDAAGVKDLVELNARRDAGDAGILALGPVPRLVVIIDEFAALARTLSGEIGSLTDLTARGRSLGVHLLLATQKPAAAVTAEIRTNTRMRISLLVEDKQDSMDVIGIPDAASVSVKGRAFVRIGQADVIPVQTALSTAVTEGQGGPAITVAPFVFGTSPRGQVTAAYTLQKVRPAPTGPSDLDLLVRTMRSVYDRAGVAPPRRPWPDPLPDVLPLEQLAAAGSTPPQPDAVHFALADDPEAQTRYPVGWTPEQGNLLLYGVVGSGTTTALAAIALAALTQRSPVPRDTHLYVLDFGADELRVLEQLPHTGAVVGAAERERQVRLIRWLRAEVERRQQLPGAQRRAEPRVVVLIDNFEGVRAAFDDAAGQPVLDTLLRVWADGPECGVHLAVTAQRVGGVPGALASATPAKVAFRLADIGDYGLLNVRRDQVPSFVPGRAVLGETAQVVQVAKPAPSLPAAVEAVAASARPPARRPTSITTLPTEVPLDHVTPASEIGPERWVLGVGVGDGSLAPVGLTLYEHEHGSVIGPARSGRSTTLLTLAASVKAADPKARVLAVARRRSPLRDHPLVDRVATTDDELRGITDAVMVAAGPTLLLVDDAESVEDPTGALQRLVDLAPPTMRIILAGRSDSLRSLYGHWTQTVRRSKAGILLVPDRDMDGDLLGAQLPRRIHVTMQPGRGFLVADGTVDLVQIAR
jgi:S-DNA-T family DNA segregation ATPase FtsK/SpoIIIE